MPFTPLHMGPGLAIKALVGRRFSVLAFGIAQVAMDIEPLVGLIRDADVLHGPTHTYVAALVIAVAVILLAPPVSRPILSRWNRELSMHRLSWLVELESTSLVPVVVGALAGTISHVMLDSIMHSDISPLMPWSESNALFGLISIEALHQVCIVAGVCGVLVWFSIGWLMQRAGIGRDG